MNFSRGPDRRVLLVCHAGAEIGIGHLGRMLSLGAALTGSAPTEVEILIQGQPIERDDLAELEHSYVGFDADLLDAVIEKCDQAAPSVAVFDLHPEHLPDDFAIRSAVLREAGTRLVGVDSLLEECDSLDLTWVPSLLVDESAVAGCEGTVHSGWDSFLITRRLPVEEWAPGNRVLVLTGGGDVTDQNATLPALLDQQLPDRSEISWVRGPFADAPVLPVEPRHAWMVHESPGGLDELIKTTDYAITVFGVTLFELLQYGVPTVVFSPYDDRRVPELEPVAAAGAAVVAGDASTAVGELASLMADDDRAAELSREARHRMRVNGAERLAGLIHSLGE
jgi:spore coat polysaccharide biosynthesis predicted glycosyltransferase SpsG